MLSINRPSTNFHGGGMNWNHIVFTALIGGVVASMTDWAFAGDWLYKRFNAHPEIWRVNSKNEWKAIAGSAALPFLTCGVFAAVCARLDLHSYSATLKLALAIWLIAPLPVLITHGLFVKLQSGIVVSYAIGWLVKLGIAALAVAFLFR
jgi:hypothetical protein